MAFSGSPFHHHLSLTTEYERLVAENAELRKELHKDGGCLREHETSIVDEASLRTSELTHDQPVA